MSGYAHVRNGSKAEKLQLSICFPLFTQQRTSVSANCHFGRDTFLPSLRPECALP